MCIGLSLGLLLEIFSSISWSYIHFVDGFLCWAETFKSDVVLLWWFCFCRLCFFLTFFYFWLCWVFFVVWGLLVAVLLRSTGSRHMGIRCGTQASVVVARWLSSCSSRALGCELSGLWHMGSVAPQHMEYSGTRDWICAPCIGRWILIHCATKEALTIYTCSYFWALYPIPLVCVSVLMPVLCCFDHCVCVLVTQLCLTLCNSVDCYPPGSSVHRILQARVLENCVAIPFSKGSSRPRDGTRVSHITRKRFTIWATITVAL